jgi:iron(III) transport system substrate-binding protein
MRRWRVAAAVLLLALLVGPARAAEPADAPAVVAAAKQEATLTLYNGTALAMIRVIAERFKAQYGISVDILEGRASEIYERIRTEQATARHVGDLMFSGSSSMVAAVADGVLAPHGALPNTALLAANFPDDGTITPVSSSFFGILASTDLVSTAEQPKSWRGLLDPKWRGKILSDDYRAAGAGEVFFNVMLDKYGRDFHEKLAAQNPQFSRFFAESERRIARGEFALYVPLNLSEYPTLKGLPVRLVMPEEGSPYVTLSLGLLKGAPHPNAARLFMNYAIGKEAQLASGSTGAGITIAGIADDIPAEQRPLALPKLFGTSTPSRLQEMLKLATEIYH